VRFKQWRSPEQRNKKRGQRGGRLLANGSACQRSAYDRGAKDGNGRWMGMGTAEDAQIFRRCSSP
jgi:hypothetical protein